LPKVYYNTGLISHQVKLMAFLFYI